MKRDGITIMLVGLGITIITAILYFSKMNEPFMNKFVIEAGGSFHFNWAPMIGILVMAIGEFLLWESQSNADLKELKTKLVARFRLRISTIKLGLIYVSNLHLINFRVLRVLIMFFKI